MSLAWTVIALVFYLTGIAVMRRAERAHGRSRTTSLMIVVGLYLAGTVCGAIWVAGADNAPAVRIGALVIMALTVAVLAWAMHVLVRSLRESADPINGMAP